MRKVASALVYAFVGLPALLAALFLAGASPRLLDRATWEGAADDERLWTALRSAELPLDAAERSGIHFDGDIELGDYRFDGPALVKAAQAELPWDELRAFSASSLHSAFDVLEGKQSASLPGVDLRPLERMLDARADEMARAYIALIPKNAEGAVADPKDLRTLPSGLDVTKAAAAATLALREGIAAIPDTTPAGGTDAPRGGLVAARAGLAVGTTWTLVSALGLWLGLGFAAHGAWSRRLRWLGTTLAIPGGIVLGTGLLIRLPFEAVLRGMLRAPELGAFLATPAGAGLMAWARDILALISNGWLVSGGIAAAAAAAFLGARRALDAAERPEER